MLKKMRWSEKVIYPIKCGTKTKTGSNKTRLVMNMAENSAFHINRNKNGYG